VIDQEAMRVKAMWLVKMIKPKTEVLVIDLCADMLPMMVLPKRRQLLHVLRDIQEALLVLLVNRPHGSESLRLEERLHWQMSAIIGLGCQKMKDVRDYLGSQVGGREVVLGLSNSVVPVQTSPADSRIWRVLTIDRVIFDVSLPWAARAQTEHVQEHSAGDKSKQV